MAGGAALALIGAAIVLVIQFGRPAAVAGELQWRAPKIGTADPAPVAPIEEHPERAAPANEAREVQRVAHHEEEPVAGPQLILAGEVQQEPRKLRSVLVRPSAPARPIGDQAREEPTQEKRVAPRSVPRDGNILRTAQSESGPFTTWRHPQRDPFEDGPGWRKTDEAPARETPQHRTAQRESLDGPTRSVLVRDPFEAPSAPSRSSAAGASAQYVGQPQPADAQPLDRLENGTLEGFRGFGGTPTDQFAQDRSLEAERARAEESCRQALEVLETRRIRSTRDELSIVVPGAEGVDVPFECALDHKSYEPRAFAGTTYMWKASALCHKPLYFEDVHLERYGHSWGWHIQPLVSAAHFFTTVPILPYKMGLETPNECIYALGYYRPGNCAPYLIEPLGTSPRAVVWQAGAVVGAAAIIP